MNRRAFLGMAAAAVPAVALARPSDLASGGWIEGVSGEALVGEFVHESAMAPKMTRLGDAHLPQYVHSSPPSNIDLSIHGSVPNPPPSALPRLLGGDECTCIKCCTDAPPLIPNDAVSPRHYPLKSTVAPFQRQIIAFTGLAGSGKSTAALHLVNRGWQRHRFAGPLKAMLAALGLTPAQIDGDQKEVPCDLLCGKTPRWAQQSLGTEWGRDLIGSGMWARAWLASLPAGNVVVDDLRFPNEVDAIRKVGGSIVRVVRPDTLPVGTHVSESYDIPASMVIVNSESVSTFLKDVDAAVRDLSWAIAGTH